jgi:hypothetical protein
MADPRPLTRNQIAAFVGNDPEAIRAIERLFQVAGVLTPADILTLTQLIEDNSLAIGVEAGRGEAMASALRDLASQAVGIETAQATAQAALTALESINQSLSLLALAPPRPPVIFPDDVRPPTVPLPRKAYGTFFDTTTQTAAAINTAYTVSLNTTDLSFGVYLSGTQIRVDQKGLYNFQHSIQLDKTTGGKGLFYLWYMKNGTDVPDSATRIRLEGNNSEQVASWNYVFNLKANDYIEYRWSVNNTDVQIRSFATVAPAPATPSVIVTVTNNIGD